MGDVAEAKYDENDIDDGVSNKFGTIKSSVMQRLTVNLSKGTAQSKEFKEALSSIGHESNQQRLIRKTLKRKTKLPDILRKALDNSDEMEYYNQVLNTRNSNLDKLHFIIGHGILRPNLRYHNVNFRGIVFIIFKINLFFSEMKFFHKFVNN